MSEIKETTNPVGQAKIDDTLQSKIDSLCIQWDKTEEKVPWWKIWKTKGFVLVTNFLLAALDDFVNHVDKLNLSGPDKKATVMKAVSILYDYVVREAFPIWAKPFSSRIKDILINHVLAAAIDWIVAKYHDGVWTKTDPEKTN